MIRMVEIDLPIPSDFNEWTWLGLGILFGRAFGKNLDQDIQKSEWFKNLKKNCKWQAWLVKRILDFTHHWWIGALIMLCTSATEIFWLGRLPVSMYYFGYGLFLDDLPDIPKRLRNMLGYLWKKEIIIREKGKEDIIVSA